MERLGAIAKCAPPLRSRHEQRELWQRLADISTVGSDHSPSPPEMKQDANFFQVWGGISGCQHLLSLLLDYVPATQIARLTSSGVAERFSLPQKGGFAIGKDADFTLVENTEEVVTGESLHYRHRQSPYVGRKLRGRVVRTFLRGQVIFENGSFSLRTFGQFVRPAP